MRWLADVVYGLAGLAYVPIALYQALIVGKNRRGWCERFGRLRSFDPNRRRIWIHAVSLGEINATPRLVEALQEHLPDCEIVFSSTTDTGHARAVQLYGQDRVFRFPLDFSPVIESVLRRVNPSMLVLIELEVWYNLVTLTARRGVPVVVVNGRLTARSTRRLARLGRTMRAAFAKLTWVGAQDETIAARFRTLGVKPERVEALSSLKWDSAEVTNEVDGADELARALGLDRRRPTWVCGSTGPGEEEMILDAYRRLLDDRRSLAPNVQADPWKDDGVFRPVLVIVPRKPERFDEVARLIERGGFTCCRRSRHPDGTPAAKLPSNGVVLGDTMGELRKFYSLADVVFVGRTLVPMGGSDPMEVAALGKAIVVGPHTDNFQLPVEALGRADAIRVVSDSESLSETIDAILSDASLAKGLGRRAQQVVIQNQGATRHTAEKLVDLLKA